MCVLFVRENKTWIIELRNAEMARPIDEIAALTIHLQQKPIATILENCSEKNNLTALRFMCIVDYHTRERNLYMRIGASSHPKLLAQLLQFRQFETFKFYDYRVNTKIGKRVLKCKYCELIGPYGCILTHMTINHNVHIGLKKCVFCNHEELRTHIAQNTLNRCYNDYILRHNIEINKIVCGIVDDFYNMLKKISEKLSISTIRNQGYAAQGYSSVERLQQSYGNDFPTEITVSRLRTTNQYRSIQSNALNEEFERIMEISYPGNYADRLIREPLDSTNVIVIESDDDGNENNVDDSTHNSADHFMQSQPGPHDTNNRNRFQVSLLLFYNWKYFLLNDIFSY